MFFKEPPPPTDTGRLEEVFGGQTRGVAILARRNDRLLAQLWVVRRAYGLPVPGMQLWVPPRRRTTP